MDGFEESHSSGWLRVSVCFFKIDKGGDASYCTIFVAEDPANAAAVMEEGIALRIEDGIDLFVQGANPAGIVFIEKPGQFRELPGMGAICYFLQLHHLPSFFTGKGVIRPVLP